jgi:flagellar biosynthesis component FlhA
MNDAPLPFEIVVDPILSPLIDCQPLAEKIRAAAVGALRTLVRELGLPVAPQVQFGCEPISTGVALRVRGRDVPYPRDSFAQVRSSWSKSDNEWRDWVAEHVANGRWERARDDAAVGDAVAVFMGRLIGAIAVWRPDRLFDEEVAKAWLAVRKIQSAIPWNGNLPEPSRLVKILRPVLALGIAIADAATILPILDDAESDSDELAERLIERLRSDSIFLLANPSYWRELPADFRDEWQRLRDNLFFQLGVRVPPIHFLEKDTMLPRMMALRIHHVTLPPRLGLAPNELFAAASAESLQQKMKLKASPVPHPLGGAPGAVVADGANELAAGGIMTWNPVSFAMLCVEQQLRRHAGALVSVDRVEAELAALHEPFPELVLSALERVPLTRMAELFRALLVEQASIRNSRTILQSAATFDTVVLDGQSRIALDDRLVLHPRLADHASANDVNDIVAFVRIGLRLQIEAQSRRGGTTLQVLLLDQAMEDSLLDLVVELARGGESALIAASVRKYLTDRIEAAWTLPGPPVLLTTVTVRRALRILIGDDFPDATVIAYDELPTTSQLQPFARITPPNI